MADAAPQPADADHEAEADTIATRTRTKFSLVDVPIDTLEASLPDAAPDPVGIAVPFVSPPFGAKIQTLNALFGVWRQFARVDESMTRTSGARGWRVAPSNDLA
jgi:hypothetical protein